MRIEGLSFKGWRRKNGDLDQLRFLKKFTVNNHKSITAFSEKYSRKVWREYLFSQHDVGHREQLILKPIYMLPFALEELLENPEQITAPHKA